MHTMMLIRSFLTIVTVVLVAVACSPEAPCASGRGCLCNDGTDQTIGCASPVPDCTAACADHGGFDGGVPADGG
jgi:hypothetical protein